MHHSLVMISGLQESFAHKISRKSELIKGCAAATFVSLIVSVIVMIPGIGKDK